MMSPLQKDEEGIHADIASRGLMGGNWDESRAVHRKQYISVRVNPLLTANRRGLISKLQQSML